MERQVKSWTARTSLEIVRRRAGGRNRYNARRRLAAMIRRMRVMELLKGGSVLERGTQARLARALAVSEATISRDIAALLYGGEFCPRCGALRNSTFHLKPIRTGRCAHVVGVQCI